MFKLVNLVIILCFT